MSLEWVENIIEWAGGLLAYSALGLVLYGVWRGAQRRAGRTTGRTGSWLRSPWFYFASVALFFGIGYLGWIPLPWPVPPVVRAGMLALGCLLFFPGLLFAVWGRLALGKKLLCLDRFRRAVIRRSPVGRQRAVCYRAPPHVHGYFSCRHRQPADLLHLDNLVVCLFRALVEHARPPRGNGAGSGVWRTVASLL